MKSSQEMGEIASALAAAQSEIGLATKDALNPHLKSKYADIAAVIEAVRPALSKNKISILQFPEVEDTEVTVETRLLHASGQWVAGEVKIPVVKWDAHGVGSAITYGRRYGLLSILSIATEDDDGAGAVNASPKQPELTEAGIAFKKRLEEAAEKGEDALKKAWAAGAAEDRKECQRLFGTLKEVASKKS